MRWLSVLQLATQRSALMLRSVPRARGEVRTDRTLGPVREAARRCGYYAPERTKVEISVEGKPVQAIVDQLGSRS